MANRFYQPGAQRASKVRDLFSVIAKRYDLINDLQSFGLHRYWKGRLVRLACPGRDDRVLDLCCGTGDIALQFARVGTQVVGLDFSVPMLTIAQARARRAGLPIRFLNGDALNLPFPDNCFDIVTVGYGLRNLADFRRGLSEMHRVLRPGGRLLVLDFGKPSRALLRTVYFFYLEHWVPVFGRLLCGDAAPYQYIAESLRHYPAQAGVAEAMTALECDGISVWNLLGGMMSINAGRKRTVVARGVAA